MIAKALPCCVLYCSSEFMHGFVGWSRWSAEASNIAEAERRVRLRFHIVLHLRAPRFPGWSS